MNETTHAYHRSMHQMPYSTESSFVESNETISERIKQLAFQSMITAWDNYDFCLEYRTAQQWFKMLDSLFSSIHAAFESITILYSASLEVPKSVVLVKHLLISSDAFALCHPDFLNQYEYWQSHKKQIVTKQGLAEQFVIFLHQTHDFLESVERYYFKTKRELYYTSEEQRKTHRIQQQLLAGIVGLILLLGGLYPVYQHLRPTQVYQTKGQIFWTSEVVTGENEDQSLRFSVKEDGMFHEYVIDTIIPIAMTSLRFDPGEEKNAEIWIDQIEIYESDREDPSVIHSFAQTTEDWIANGHVQALRNEQGMLTFQTTGRDPFIRLTGLSLSQVTRIKIKMKVTLFQTYVQWIFS